MDYCSECAHTILQEWSRCGRWGDEWSGWRGNFHTLRGEKRRDLPPIPLLPRIINGSCEACGGTNPIPAEQIVWVNEGPGLPDSWSLMVAEPDSFYRKWGRPYHHEAECPECGARVVVSVHVANIHFGGLQITSCSECGVLERWPRRTRDELGF
jgi:hypothetical protein